MTAGSPTFTSEMYDSPTVTIAAKLPVSEMVTTGFAVRESTPLLMPTSVTTPSIGAVIVSGT